MHIAKSNHRHVFEVKSSKGYKIVDSKEIVFLEAKGKFTIVHFADQSEIVTFHLLKWYSKISFNPCFFRCHNSYIINFSFVDSYTNKEIVLTDGSKVPLSRNKASSFKENLKSFVLSLDSF